MALSRRTFTENGSGKTTLSKLINGAFGPESPGSDSVTKYPGIVSRFGGQVALALHKAAQVTSLDLAADIP